MGRVGETLRNAVFGKNTAYSRFVKCRDTPKAHRCQLNAKPLQRILFDDEGQIALAPPLRRGGQESSQSPPS